MRRHRAMCGRELGYYLSTTVQRLLLLGGPGLGAAIVAALALHKLLKERRGVEEGYPTRPTRCAETPPSDCVVQQPENPPAIADPGEHRRWSEVVASLAFSLATFEMLTLYGIVHWDIMFRWTVEAAEPRQAVLRVLGHLSMLRLIFAALALAWVIWSFRGAPRWAAWVALGLAIAAPATNTIVM